MTAVAEGKKASAGDAAKHGPIEAAKSAPAVPTDAKSILNVHFNLLYIAHSSNDKRLVSRILHHLSGLRAKLTKDILLELITPLIPSSSAAATSSNDSVGRLFATMAEHLKALPVEDVAMSNAAPSDVAGSNAAITEAQLAAPAATTQPSAFAEKEIYLVLLASVVLLDRKEYLLVREIVSAGIALCNTANLRTLDPLLARFYFYLMRSHESENKLSEMHNLLMTGLRTATLRHDTETQATIYNCLLRTYLQYDQFEQADKLIAKSPFPEKAGNNQQTRYMFYLAWIRAIQMNYREALDALTQSIRKIPQGPSATGFLQAAHKILIVVQLLIGEIPERALFTQPKLKAALQPYFNLAQAVRLGSPVGFQQAIAASQARLIKDKTFALALRLHQNVLRAGLKRINAAYARITMEDIKTRLCLQSVEDAEYIVMKAIRDGVIDACVVHTASEVFLQSKTVGDVYSSNEPQHALHQRIKYCQSMRQESVKAMRFPDKAIKDSSGMNNDSVLRFSMENFEMMADFMDDEGDMNF